MANTTKALDDDFNDIIGRPHVRYYEDIKPASSEKQKAFNALNESLGKDDYLDVIATEQKKLRKGNGPSCEACIYYESEEKCKTCDEDWSEFNETE